MKIRTLCLAAALVVALPPVAARAQLAAGEEPTVSGPLDRTSRNCTSHKRFVGDEVAAVAKACIFIYDFDPTSESNADRDYSAVWLQSEVDPKPGWCISKVTSDLLIPEGTPILNKAPKPKTATKKKSKKVRSELDVTAEGTATDDGLIKQNFTLFPTKMTRWVKDDDDRQIYRLKWSGEATRVVAFASGAEISYPEGEAPPEGISLGLNYNFKDDSEC